MNPLKTRKAPAFLALLAGVLAFWGAGALSAVYAQGDAAGYIVKYKESAAWMREDDSLPFDVVSEEEMRRLAAADLLAWYEPDGEMTLLDDGFSRYYTDDKWDLALIHADAAFEDGFLGQNVCVGILDSGINPHEEIADRLLAGHNYLTDGNPADTADNVGHGTSVAGLIAGAGKNGCIGAAPGATVVPLKVTDGSGVSVSTVCRAIYGGIDDYDCDILNMSLGIKSASEALKEAVDYAEEKGVLIVAAAGNGGSRAKVYPAAYDTVIGVGAVDEAGKWFYHSNHNDSVFITAPGSNVKTLGRYGGYELRSGTSFAVPYVTAAAAVMLSVDGSLSPARIREILALTATDKGDAGYDEYYGTGLLDVESCLSYLTGGACRFYPSSGAASQIKNVTGAQLQGIYLLAEYAENGACINVTAYDVTIPPKGAVAIEPPPESTGYGQFILQPATLAPLTSARKALTNSRK